MHLVVFAEDFYPNTSGGAHERWRFCKLAVEKGHTVTVFTPHETGLARAETVAGVEIRRPLKVKPEGVPTYSPLALFTRIIASIVLLAYALQWMYGRDVDGLHSASHLTHWVAKTVAVVYALPLVSYIGYTPSVKSTRRITPKLLLERVNFRLFMGSVVFCRAARVKRVLEASTDADVVVLHGILNSETLSQVAADTDRNQVRNDLEVEDSDSLIVTVGRLVPIKNPVGAVEVISQLPTGYTLAIVGDGSERETVERAVREHDVEARVRLCGTLPHEEALATIAVADALVLPSHAEAYPTVVFEALALGCDVFATPVGVLPEIDHPRLHLGEVDTLPELIETTRIQSNQGFDADTLDQFSMECYTDELLGAFEKSATNEINFQ